VAAKFGCVLLSKQVIKRN